MLLETYLMLKQPVIQDVIIDRVVVCYQPTDVGHPRKSRPSGARYKEIV